MKRQREHTKIKLGKRKKAEPFTLPKSPGTLAGFYFSCGPVAAFGFFLGNLEGFVFAIVGDVIFWVLIALLKDINEKRKGIGHVYASDACAVRRQVL